MSMRVEWSDARGTTVVEVTDAKVREVLSAYCKEQGVILPDDFILSLEFAFARSFVKGATTERWLVEIRK